MDDITPAAWAVLQAAHDLQLGKPWEWSRKDWTIDALDKVVVIAATGAIFDRLLGPKATLTSVGRS